MARKKPKTATMVTWDIHMAGIDHMKNLLAAMPQTLRTGICVPIVRTLSSTGAKIAKQELKRVLPVRDRHKIRWQTPTGALHDSLGSKVIPASRRRNRDVIYGVFGARSDFRVTRVTSRRVAAIKNYGLKRRVTGPLAVGAIRLPNGKTGRRGNAIKPHKYIHLVEFGHQRGAGPVEAEPYPFIRPARRRLESLAPGIIRERWNTLYPQQVAKMKRRHMKKADIDRQVEEFQRRSVRY